MRRIPFGVIIPGILALAALSFAALLLLKVLLFAGLAAIGARIATRSWQRYNGLAGHRHFSPLSQQGEVLQLRSRRREHVITID